MIPMRESKLRAKRVGLGYVIQGSRFYVWDEDPCEALAWGITLGHASAAAGGRGTEDPNPDDGLRRSG